MVSSLAITQFAPATRADAIEVRIQSREVTALPLVTTVLDAMPHIVVVLNKYRQIVFANTALLDAFADADAEIVMGARPGEALGCIHGDETSGGCGTTRDCTNCGAVQAILQGLDGHTDQRECRIVRKDGQALELSVKAAPLVVGTEIYTILSSVDIGGDKRRQMLERIFFHDVLNTAGGVLGLVQLMAESAQADDETGEIIEIISANIAQLVDEIASQKQLADAENGHLRVAPEQIDSRELIESVMSFHQRQSWAQGCTISLDDALVQTPFASDIHLLRRSLGNLLKNALEASDSDSQVTLGCELTDDDIVFWVHNDAVMNDEVQRNLFHRCFSTKDHARGLGAYSVKLLVEQYLVGRVSFTSDQDTGTTFRVSLPQKVNADA